MHSAKDTASNDIIAIDGPAGSGKSTVARLLAKRLGYSYIDTGAMYRALTLKAMREKFDFNNEEALTTLAKNAHIDIVADSESAAKVLLDGEDVSSLIRTPELTNNVFYVAKAAGVRDKMKENQRRIGSRGRSVFEGRDIGTVVFPFARYKFYLDAEFSERVRRRHKEMLSQGYNISCAELEKDLKIRDDKDINRSVAPLKRAEDARYIDTTSMSIEQVVDKLAGYVKENK